MVVQNVDAEKQHDVDHPSAQRNLVWRDKEWRVVLVELRNVAGDSHKKELSKSHEGPWKSVNCLS